MFRVVPGAILRDASWASVLPTAHCCKGRAGTELWVILREGSSGNPAFRFYGPLTHLLCSLLTTKEPAFWRKKNQNYEDDDLLLCTVVRCNMGTRNSRSVRSGVSHATFFLGPRKSNRRSLRIHTVQSSAPFSSKPPSPVPMGAAPMQRRSEQSVPSHRGHCPVC